MNNVFIILNYNSRKLTEILAKKIANMNSITNVIVVDNCSTDDSFEQLKKIKNSKIDVIKSEKNGGYSYGNNFGIKYAKKYSPEIIFICNPDVDVEEKELIKILEEFEKNNQYAILSGIEYDINNNISKPEIWNQMSYKDDLLDCYFLYRKLILKNKKTYNYVDYSKEIQDVDVIKGSFFAIRYEDLIEINGFDESVFLFCEERIISKKIKDKDKKIGIVTNMRYNHNHSVSINEKYKNKADQMKLLYKSRLYFNKNYNKINNFKYILLYISMKLSIIEFKIYDLIRNKRIK